MKKIMKKLVSAGLFVTLLAVVIMTQLSWLVLLFGVGGLIVVTFGKMTYLLGKYFLKKVL